MISHAFCTVIFSITPPKPPQGQFGGGAPAGSLMEQTKRGPDYGCHGERKAVRNVLQLPERDSLIQRRISEHRAVEIANTFPAERIRRQMDWFDWLRQRRDRTISRNAPGFLIAAIERDFKPSSGLPPAIVATTLNVRSPKKQPASKAKTRSSDNLRLPHEREMIQEYWRSIPEHERTELEGAALSNAGSFHRAYCPKTQTWRNSLETNVICSDSRQGIEGGIGGRLPILVSSRDTVVVNPLTFLLVCAAGCMNRQLQLVIEYLQEEIRVLKEQLGKPPRFTDD